MQSKPHGGVLVDRTLQGSDREAALRRAGELPSLELSQRQAREVENLATGVYSPLQGFMKEADFKEVVANSRLAGGVAWTIPIVLDVSKDEAKQYRAGQPVTLKFGGRPMALLQLEEIYAYDKKEYARQVFGTEDESHPGVAYTYSMKDTLLGGAVDLVDPPESPFGQFKLSPKQTRAKFESNGWSTVVGFQTRNIPHLGHEALQKAALNLVDGLFINPLVGGKKAGDFEDPVIMAAYDALLKNYYPSNRAAMAVLQGQMRYAGPKEAIFHAIVRKNFGCTHFIVGRDHAGVGKFYHPYAAQEIFKDFPDLGITPMFFPAFFRCLKCGGLVNEKVCPHSGPDRVDFSGTKLRAAILEGEAIDDIIRPEVAAAIRKSDAPFRER